MRLLVATTIAAAFCAAVGCINDDTKPLKREPKTARPPAATSIQWIADDYRAALRTARAGGKPLVIDLWAPWCHTCLSMKHVVLDSPALATYSERFVWLAIDTDKPANAEVLRKYTPEAWPTFYVVSPIDESIQARHVGGASLEQFRELLTAGENGHLDVAAGSGTSLPPAVALVRRGDRAAAAAHYPAAIAAYEQALAMSTTDWGRRNEVLLHLASALLKDEKHERCVELVASSLASVAAKTDASAADLGFVGLECAGKVSEQAKSDLAHFFLDPHGPLVALALATKHHLSADDSSELLRLLRTAAVAVDDWTAAEEWALRQVELLDDAAAHAPDSFAKMAYNWPRAEAYAYLGRGDELINELEQSSTALPDQYDPPYRLAWIQLIVGDYDDALTNAQVALSKAYGPRKGRVYSLLAEIYDARMDHASALATRQAQLDHYRQLETGHRRDKDVERVQKLIDQSKRRQP